MDENICVYSHVNRETKEVFYIGLGKQRCRPYSKKRSDEWIEYVKSIFFNYDVVILYENLDYHEAGLKEKELIAQIGRKDKGLGTLLNKSDGGEGCNVKLAVLEKQVKSLINEENKLLLLEQEIINNASSCKNEEEFIANFYEDFLIAKRLKILENVKSYFGANKHKSNVEKIQKINYLFDVSDSNNFRE